MKGFGYFVFVIIVALVLIVNVTKLTNWFLSDIGVNGQFYLISHVLMYALIAANQRNFKCGIVVGIVSTLVAWAIVGPLHAGFVGVTYWLIFLAMPTLLRDQQNAHS